MEPFEASEELTSKYRSEHPHRQQEAFRGSYPAFTVQRRTSSRHDAMQVWVQYERLAPGVQNREDSQVSPEVLGIGRDLEQRLGGAVEQQIIEHLGVAQSQNVELLRQGEDDVKVGHRQQFVAPPLEPAFLLQVLTLRTVTVAAGVVDRLFRAALLTAVQVSSQNRGAAVFDGPHGL